MTEFKVEISDELLDELEEHAKFRGLSKEEFIRIITETFLLGLFPQIEIEIGRIITGSTAKGYFPHQSPT